MGLNLKKTRKLKLWSHENSSECWKNNSTPVVDSADLPWLWGFINQLSVLLLIAGLSPDGDRDYSASEWSESERRWRHCFPLPGFSKIDFDRQISSALTSLCRPLNQSGETNRCNMEWTSLSFLFFVMKHKFTTKVCALWILPWHRRLKAKDSKNKRPLKDKEEIRQDKMLMDKYFKVKGQQPESPLRSEYKNFM